MTSPVLVSVVVTTKNEEKNIQRCLESIKAQSWKNIEIIVVDNNSTDRTKEISRQFTPLVFDKGPERSAQRNYGMIDVAKGEFVIFVDADMILSPRLLERCVVRMEDKNCLALHVSEIIMGESFWCQVRRFERGFYDGTVVDGARFFRRNIFQEIGGFNEKINAAEDWDLDKRIKRLGTIALLSSTDSDPAFIYHNESDFELGKYLKKKNAYAADVSLYVAEWGKNDPDVRRQVGLWYRYVGVFVEDGKWKRLIAHPALTGGMYFLRFLVGCIFLLNSVRCRSFYLTQK